MLKKLIYSTSGLVLLGPIGAVTGFFIGDEADKVSFMVKWSNFYAHLGMLAKCDGKTNVHEIAYLKYLTEDVLKCNFNNSLLLLDSFKSGTNTVNLKVSESEFQLLLDFCTIDGKINYSEYQILNQIAVGNNLPLNNSDLDEIKSHYENLEAEPFCDYLSMKKSYHKLAQQLHPDLNPNKNSAEKFLSIQLSLVKIEEFHNRKH